MVSPPLSVFIMRSRSGRLKIHTTFVGAAAAAARDSIPFWAARGGFTSQRWRAPSGHTTHLQVFIDPDLLQYDEIWATAGTWHDVFGIEPHKVVTASDALVTDLKKG